MTSKPSRPILRPEFTALMDAESMTRGARKLRSPENILPEHEAKATALALIDEAIGQLVAARALIDPAPAQEKSDD